MAGLLKISEAASIALHVMSFLDSRDGQLVSAREIAKCLRCSEAHLAKVLQRLGKLGLVKSTRGPHGGFSLGRQSSGISLLEIYEAIEGPLRPEICLFDESVCSGGQCILGGLVEKIGREFRDYLKTKRLSEFKKVFVCKKIEKDQEANHA